MRDAVLRLYFCLLADSAEERTMMTRMLSEFEKALVFHEDLDRTARQLTEQANAERNERCRQIQHDLQVAQLIQYALLEPRETGVFAIGKAYLRMFQRKHNPHGDVLAHLLMKEAECEDTKERKETRTHEPDEGNTAKTASQYDDGTIREGEESETGIHKPVPEETSGKGS